MQQFLMIQSDGHWTVRDVATRYRAWKRQEISDQLYSAGFEDIKWLMPEESGYYQPVVLAYSPPV